MSDISEAVEKEHALNISLEQIADAISSTFGLNPIWFEYQKITEHLFKKQRKIKLYYGDNILYYGDKIYFTEIYQIREDIDPEDHTVNFFNEPATRNIGTATYQHCCDMKKDSRDNYFLLEVRLKNVDVEGDKMPVRVLIKCRYCIN